MTDHVTVRSRGYLPHWERDSACYFVTFRTADSLPAEIADEISSQHKSILCTAQQMHRDLSASEEQHLARLQTIEKYLDRGAGACHLAKREVANIVANALRHFDGKRYCLFAWCVMPNHVHVVFQVSPEIKLGSVPHSWKSFTAKQINAALGIQGEFWQHEYYDHLVRNDGDLERVVRYVMDNPITAGRIDWPWLWVRPNLDPGRRDAGAMSKAC